MAPSPAIAALETEFRQLAQDARSKEGLAGFFSSAADQQAVKDAAERVILKVRSFAEAPDALDQVKTHYQEVLKPLQLSLETKSDRLKSRALAITQNLIANHALPAEASDAVIAMLTRVDKNTDENVQLKTLQTALTLLQSPLRPAGEEQIGAVLGVCLRLTNKKGHKDAVLTTAAATVRQAVALVLSYVDVEAELQAQAEGAGGGGGSSGGGGGEAATPPAGAASAAQKLVEDLCNIASGAPPLWLKSPSLPRTFVLELLDFVLANSPDVFRRLPPFQNALAVRMTQLIQAQLQDHLEAGAAGASFATANFPTFRALLRLARTLLRSYYPLLGPRAGTLVQAVVAGLAPRYPLYQRVALMQLVRSVLADPALTYHLFSCYDLTAERKLDAVQALCKAAGDVLDATLLAANKDPEDEPPLEVVASLYADKTAGKDWNMDVEFEAAGQQAQRGYLAMLAIDALLAFMGSVEKLADMAVEQGGAVPPALSKGPGSVERVQADVCRAMVDRTWRGMLSVVSQLLQRSSGEEIVLQLLKGYQTFTQACGTLQLLEPRDAFLANLCEFALAVPPGAASHGEGEISPRAYGERERLASPRGGAAALAAAAEAAEAGGLVLAPKNVQSMRTLFNIAHRLSNVLGGAWALVLETMNTLDRILHSPRTTTQEVSVQVGGEAGLSSDLAILSAAASQLFECTRDMSRDAVVSLLSGLRDVSMRNIPSASELAVGQAPKLFALNRMVEVLLYNISRIYDLWAIFLSHVLEVINDPKPAVRAAAIDALGRATIGALGALPPAGAPSSAGGEGAASEGAAAATAESTGGVEHMLLVALEALYNGDKERDVRLGVLRVLLNVLQRHGERLSDGWTPVFRLLAAVPAGSEADAVDLAFQSVQLTCSDYMAAMPFARLKRCLEVAVLYGSQQADVNVSLTTISLLWNAADLFGKAGAGGAARTASASARTGSVGAAMAAADAAEEDDSDTEVEAAVVELPPPSPGAEEVSLGSDEEAASPSAKLGQLAARLTAAQSEELLQMIFLALQAVSQDVRPEVRNSGVRTLFAVVVNQGPRLSRALWEQCLWEMLFPLLNHAYLMSATASRDEAESMLLGQSRGKEVRVMVHHSRNTEQKQWDETVVIALGGMARLLRAHLPAIVGMDRVAAGWEEMMVVVESSMAGGRKEVALAAIALLSAVLQAHGSITDIVTPAMWKRSVRALGVGVEAATSPACMVPLMARTELLALVGQLYGSLRSRFDAEDTTVVFVWVEKFCRNPWSDDDAANSAQVVMGMPPVQKSALAMLPKLAPTHLPQLYPEYIYSIVRLLRPEHVIEQWQEQQAEAAERAASAAAAAQQFTIPAEPAATAAAGSPPPPGGAVPAPSDSAGLLPATATVKQPPGQVAQARFALTSAFLERAIEQLVGVYREAPLDVRATTFASVVSGLGRCMEVRYIVYHESLWRVSAQAFNAAVPAGLPALAAAAAGGEDTAASWEALADAFETFLLGANVLAGSMAPSAEASLASDVGLLRTSTASASGAASRSASQGQEATSAPPRAPGEAGGPAAPPPPQAAQHAALAGAAAPTPLSAQQARQDAELEVAVLDCLTDAVLTQCAAAPPGMKRRLIQVVDRGAVRPRELSVPQATTSSNFGHVCIRKMYVLCSRGGGPAPDPDGCLLEVARLALPAFMARCDAVLRAYAEDQARLPPAQPGAGAAGAPAGAAAAMGRGRLDEVLCILEVLASMSLAPAVADAALPPSECLAQTVASLRSRPEVRARGRERTHLLLLYSALCGCITCRESRVREMVKDVLLLAGAELGVGMPLPPPPAAGAPSRGASASAAASRRASSVGEA